MDAPKIHSLHIIGSQKLGGAESFFIRLVTSLSQAGHPVDVVCRPDSGVFHALKDSQVTVHTVAMRNLLDIFSRWKLRRIIATVQPDVVQTYMGRATRLTRIPQGVACKLIARLGGYYKLNGYRHADSLVGNTQQIHQYLLDQKFSPDKCHYIPNFVGQQAKVTTASNVSSKFANDDLIVLGLGRQVEKKGFDWLIDAFAKLPSEINGRPVKLVMLGDGRERDALTAQVQRLNLQQRVLMPGWQTNVWPWFNRADLFTCPSRHEPLGNVILEAWAAGKAVVSTANDGACELIEPNTTGVIVDMDDAVNGLAEAMLTLLSNDQQRESLAQAGLQQVAQQFSEESVRDQYLQLYRAHLSNGYASARLTSACTAGG